MKYARLLAVLIASMSMMAYAPLVHAKTHATKTNPIAPAAATPSDIVKDLYAQLLSTMKQGDQLGYSGRFKKLQPVITSAYNLPLMARLSVGSVWDKATPDEQQQLTTAFSDFSVANYASRFVRYNGEQLEVMDEKPVSGGVIVETQITPKDGTPVAINYMMRQDEKGAYRIVDVFLDGSISELATRRAEFNSIVTRDGIPALVNSLGEKSKQMGPS